MMLSIIQDSIIIFLLIYAVLQLAEHLIRFLVQCFKDPACSSCKYHVIDVSETIQTQLEYTIRSEMMDCKTHTFLITEYPDKESNLIIAKMCNEYDFLYPVTRSEFLRIVNSPEALDAFLSIE